MMTQNISFRASDLARLPFLGVVLTLAAVAVAPLAAVAEDPATCGSQLKGKAKKQVVVVEAMELESTEAALEAAEEETGQKIEVLFEDRFLTEDPLVAKAVKKDSAKRGCEVAIITRLVKQQIGQRPVRVGGVGGATIAQAVFRHDATVHYGHFVDSED